MQKNFLKKIRDNIPDSLKLMFSSIFRNKLVQNRLFINSYETLMKRESLTETKIKQIQLFKLKEILIYSFQNVPYYQELFKRIAFDPYKFSDFKQMSIIPLLTKEMIRNNFDKLISNQRIRNGYYVATTGGSTGEPLKVLLDYDSIFKEIAHIYYYRHHLGYNFKDKLATFRGIEFEGKLWRPNPMYNEMILSPFKLSKLTVQRYVAKVDDYRPQYLNGYLSSIYYLAKLLSEHNIAFKTNLKGIFLISENINIPQREYVEQFFNIRSSTFYGQSERCIIAEEKEKNRYTFDPYYGFTEHLQIDNNHYSIVGTGFLNHIMPLIRYKTDDICTPENHYFLIEGKRESTIGLYGKNHEFFSHAAFNFHSDIFKNVTSYQFIQSRNGKADLLIIVNDKFKLSEMDLMRKEIDKKIKGVIDFNIKIVDSLILSPRGKYNMFISSVNNLFI
jgi:phenylacetate-CoA ligase